MNLYDEQGVTHAVNFCYGEPEEKPRAFVVRGKEVDVDVVIEMHNRIWTWVSQPPLADEEGFLCRCIIMSWICVPCNRSYSQTAMAGRHGKKKQSLNRWIKNLKKTVPELSKYMEHMEHIKQ